MHPEIQLRLLELEIFALCTAVLQIYAEDHYVSMKVSGRYIRLVAGFIGCSTVLLVKAIIS
jgi:hypothetical protein